uniref:Uncharacterized protein n=1 Tax=Rhizophora mucronata TaxID=61149 RepID=A0A2P2PKA5_RHIMU
MVRFSIKFPFNHPSNIESIKQMPINLQATGQSFLLLPLFMISDTLDYPILATDDATVKFSCFQIKHNHAA